MEEEEEEEEGEEKEERDRNLHQQATICGSAMAVTEAVLQWSQQVKQWQEFQQEQVRRFQQQQLLTASEYAKHQVRFDPLTYFL